jgi:ABC-2 type transport system ATP-binding protein
VTLAFEHVSKRYRANGPLALDDVSWSIQSGARACLLGPNGAGKSTSIRLLQGALRPTSGRVALLGAEVDSPGYLAARRRTGIVPQGPGMYRDLTVSEMLRLAQDLYGRGGANVARVVEVFGLGDQLQQRLARLSGGMQRRLVLAVALLSEPDVLLLDEPTVGLDPLAAHDIHAFLRESMQDRTTLLCTHNLAEAEALCDEVVILRAGRVLVHAPLAELRRRARSRVRLRARQGPSVLLSAVQRRELEGWVEDDAVLAYVDDVPIRLPDLLRAWLAEGVDVFACEPLQPSLESLFLELVRESP